MKYDDMHQFSEREKEIKKWLETEYAGIQSGKLTPSILNRVTVEVYGARTALNHCAAITLEDPKTLLVTPYDSSLIGDIEDAVRKQVPSVSLSVGEASARVVAHELTGERRELLQKLAKNLAEEAKQSIRGARQDVLSDIKKKKAGDEISEEEEFAAKKQLQEQVDEANKDIEEMYKNKTQDIQT